MRILSWNVNGIRAVEKKGFLDWLAKDSPDVLCLNETKAQPGQLSPALLAPLDNKGKKYHAYWASAKRKGYAGTAIYSREEPKNVSTMGIEAFDDEGRFLAADYGKFVLICAYFPNSQEAGARLPYKLDFCASMLKYCDKLVKEGRHLVLCGDYNIAHEPIDLAHPDSNEHNPGYLPEERAWMTDFLAAGYADVFREAHPGEAGCYTWWSMRAKGARERNVGWRLDYTCVDRAFVPSVKSTAIRSDVMGADHCPVEILI